MNTLSYPIVILSSIEWNFTWQRHQALACELANVCPQVIFVESLPKRLPQIKEGQRVLRRLFKKRSTKKEQPKQGSCEGRENLTILSPIAFPAIHSIFNWLNRKFFLPRLTAKIKKRFNTPPIILNYLPTQTALDLVSQLQPLVMVYDYVDRWSGDPRTPKAVLRSHKALLQKADLIVSPSKFLAEEATQFTSKPAFVISHGVNFERFNILDSGQITNNIHTIGYFGGIGPYIDYEFLEQITRYFKLIMVGPVRTPMPVLKNVTLRPQVPHAQIAKEIVACDALIIPYKNNEYGKGINPIKLLEYFATGKPVISTPIPAVEQYREMMIVVDNGQAAVEALRNIHNWETEEKKFSRLQVARENSWSSKCDILVQEINQIIHDRIS